MAEATGPTPPLVVVALHRVDAHVRVDPLTGRVDADPRAAAPGAADESALEHGLRIAGTLGGRCAAVTLATAEADGMLRGALARGADAVLRIEPGGPGGHGDHGEPDRHGGHGDHADDPASAPGTGAASSGAVTARALARAVRAELGHPDLVLTGDHSADRGTGDTPAFLAAELDCAQALGLVDLAVTDGTLTGLRRLDRGRRERLTIPRPAVCSVEAAGIRPRRASLPATLAAGSATVPVVPADTAGAPGTNTGTVPGNSTGTGTAAGPARPVTVRSVRPYRPRAKELPAPPESDPRLRSLRLAGAHEIRQPPRVVTTDDPAEAADTLLAYLRENGYLP